MNQTPDDLAQRIKKAQERQAAEAGKNRKPDTKSSAAMGRAFRAATDLVAALVVGGLLGYWLDQWLGTLPLFMILMIFLGFGAGVLNIYRAETGQDFKVGLGGKKKEEER